VWIEARSNVHPIHSVTKGLDGYVEVDARDDGGPVFSDPPSGRLSLDVSRLSSGNRLEDREMQRRIDARRFPKIEGVLAGAQADGATGHYQISGEVTFRGVAKRYQDLMTLEAIDPQTVKLAGSRRFDIRDFGMEPPRILLLRVEPEVEVKVEIVAVKES
jgi:polyisoprenoid-binding protein YceI